jgi:hypothetical protein
MGREQRQPAGVIVERVDQRVGRAGMETTIEPIAQVALGQRIERDLVAQAPQLQVVPQPRQRMLLDDQLGGAIRADQQERRRRAAMRDAR